MLQPYYIIVSYDGTDYYGWQEQKHEQTVAGTLQNVFYRVFQQHIKVVGASRTDTGVHALGQTCRFYADCDICPEHMRHVWNASLPRDIHIRELGIPEQHFHPQHNISYKTYYYHVCPWRPLPFVSRYSWWFRYEIDANILRTASNAFVGTHDFRSFCAGDYGQRSTVCTIYDIDVRWLRRYNMYQIRVRGNRFLQHMVRRIVGAVCHVAAGRASYDGIVHALHNPNPQQHFMTAPGNGLILRRIQYKRK